MYVMMITFSYGPDIRDRVISMVGKGETEGLAIDVPDARNHS